MLPPCPHCGKDDWVYVNNRAYGWVERQYDSAGMHQEMDTDHLCFVPSQTIRCCSCQKRRRDLVFDETMRVVGK